MKAIPALRSNSWRRGDAEASTSMRLTAPYDSPDRFDQLGSVIADSVFEDDLDIFNIFNFVGRVAFNDDQVGLLARANCADALSFAEILRAVGRGNVDSFERSESSLD